MIILRQSAYSSKSSKVLYGLVRTKNKVSKLADSVSKKTGDLFTRSAIDKSKLNLSYARKNTKSDNLRETIQLKNKLKDTSKNIAQKTRYITHGIITPGDLVSDAGEFVAKHPSSIIAATCIPIPGAAETSAFLLDGPLQKAFPKYKKAAEKISGAYKGHVKEKLKNTIDGTVKLAGHLGSIA